MSVSFLTGFNELRKAEIYFADAKRLYNSKKDKKGAEMASRYLYSIDFMFKDFIAKFKEDKNIVIRVKEQRKSDLFVIDELYKKINLLQPEKRALIELAVDALNNGEQLQIEQK